MPAAQGPQNFGANNNTSPAMSAISITPGSSNLSTMVRGIYVGGAGNLQVTFPDGTQITFTNVLAGVVYPFTVINVGAATTATGLIGLI